MILSFIMSKCKSPKNPHLKPNPSAVEVSGSKTSDASFNFNLLSASLKSSNLLDSIGKIPQNTIDFIGLYPGRGSFASLPKIVTVSPTNTSDISLILAEIKPTSPAFNSSFLTSFGVLTVKSVAPVSIIFITSLTLRTPFTIRTEITTPR